MQRVGLVGWRGMVGSVLMDRMLQENDFAHFEPVFFSTSNAGGAAPTFMGKVSSDGVLHDGNSIEALKTCDIIVSCQGGDYTTQVFGPLRAAGWNGFWIDAASTLRMEKDAIIVLDPVNMNVIKDGLTNGVKNYVGGNCTVSLMMMALDGLFKANAIEWMTSMTYQAASGGGAANMRELISQMGILNAEVADLLADPRSSILEIDSKIAAKMREPDYPAEHFGVQIAGGMNTWKDHGLGNGQTKEEWKGD